MYMVTEKRIICDSLKYVKEKQNFEEYVKKKTETWI